MHIRSCMRTYATVQKLLCMEAIANISWIVRKYRAGCCLPPALAAPPAVSTNPIARRCLLKKSVQIHAILWRGRRCGVAQASFNHPRWCRPHPLWLWVALALGHGAHKSQKSIFAIFSRLFSMNNSTKSKPLDTVNSRHPHLYICPPCKILAKIRPNHAQIWQVLESNPQLLDQNYHLKVYVSNWVDFPGLIEIKFSAPPLHMKYSWWYTPRSVVRVNSVYIISIVVGSTPRRNLRANPYLSYCIVFNQIANSHRLKWLNVECVSVPITELWNIKFWYPCFCSNVLWSMTYVFDRPDWIMKDDVRPTGVGFLCRGLFY